MLIRRFAECVLRMERKLSAMNNRENLISVLRRNNPEYVPFEFVLCPSLIEKFKLTIGTVDYQDYFDFPTRWLWVKPTHKNTDFSIYHNYESERFRIDEWGVGWEKGSVAHFEKMFHPMALFESICEIERYPFPDIDADYRFEGLTQRVADLHRRGVAAFGIVGITIFEPAWYLRGLDNMLVDMVLNPAFAECLFERIAAMKCHMAAQFARSGCDLLMTGDDVSTQLDMMMDPDLWRKFLKPRLAAVIKTAKDIKPDILVYYHGDGNITKIIPDLIEIGVDILNPVQPECMDPVAIKNMYGNELSFWGTMGTQTTMPFGTVDQVIETVKKMINHVGKGGGLVLAPTHMLEPEVPLENIQAFIRAVKEYGRYC
jgi:uroporphyrinogen decarboxylase